MASVVVVVAVATSGSRVKCVRWIVFQLPFRSLDHSLYSTQHREEMREMGNSMAALKAPGGAGDKCRLVAAERRERRRS